MAELNKAFITPFESRFTEKPAFDTQESTPEWVHKKLLEEKIYRMSKEEKIRLAKMEGKHENYYQSDCSICRNGGTKTHNCWKYS